MELTREFSDLMRRFLLEGVVDPANGTEFTIFQTQAAVSLQGTQAIAEQGRHVLSTGIPDPVATGFQELTMTDPERAELEERRQKFLENFTEFFGNTPPDDIT